MNGLIWLASYPKSGSTWFRIMASIALAPRDRGLDLNALHEHTLLAADREAFDDVTLLDSAMLTPEEADLLRPDVFAAVAGRGYAHPADRSWQAQSALARIVKVHDAYAAVPDGRAMFGAGEGVILIVRDPRSIAASLANHLGCPIDQAVAMMADPDAAMPHDADGFGFHLRERISSWSRNVEGWLDQCDMPVHLVRYEALKRDTANEFRRAMAFAGRTLSDAEARHAARASEFARLRSLERRRGFRDWPRRGAGFFRSGGTDTWRTELTPEQIERLERNHDGTMRRLGYQLAGSLAGGRR